MISVKYFPQLQQLVFWEKKSCGFCWSVLDKLLSMSFSFRKTELNKKAKAVKIDINIINTKTIGKRNKIPKNKPFWIWIKSSFLKWKESFEFPKKYQKKIATKGTFSRLFQKLRRLKVMTDYEDECWSLDSIAESSISKYSKT